MARSGADTMADAGAFMGTRSRVNVRQSWYGEDGYDDQSTDLYQRGGPYQSIFLLACLGVAFLCRVPLASILPPGACAGAYPAVAQVVSCARGRADSCGASDVSPVSEGI